MAKKEKKNIIQRFSPILTSLLAMIGISLVLIFITLQALDVYTKHDESVLVPDVKGSQEATAADILLKSELGYEIVDSVYRADAKAGAVLEQIPKENTKVKRGRTIYLIIQAKGKQMVSIPPLKDYSRRQAEAQLQALGFTNISIIEEPSQFKGLVIKVLYRGNELESGASIPKGSRIELVVGAGGGIDDEMLDDSDSQLNQTPPIDESFF
ncbi:PASTA domain-containing protein [Dysgonomonas massiliensis]|uniref:PASTA domain-containing protein n=1 Tax=Dysgonomonas massiliensis TaxID=2040292 RepID=UPI000C78DFA0|nr:PASTA domain-containing protein [Dysgonomonas massiliensis]